MAPAVAPVQSLSRPMAIMSPMVLVKSPLPSMRAKTVRQALLLVWTGLMPAKRWSTAVRADL